VLPHLHRGRHDVRVTAVDIDGRRRSVARTYRVRSTVATGAVDMRYWMGSGTPPAIPDLSYVIEKGAYVAPPAGVGAINYEQSFALNDKEAAVARQNGWLAHTCSGEEIRPKRISSMTLMDPTNPDARAWRADTIAAETMSHPYVGTFMDTLRAYNPSGFYTGDPCDITDQLWLDASVDMVNRVKAATGRLVIANGACMGTGAKYYASNQAADPIIAAADAVQIEHFARGKPDQDVRFANDLASRAKLTFAHCDASASTCTNWFRQLAHPELAYLML
jgi:hypothetical protein